jgi:hypothetical protein
MEKHRMVENFEDLKTRLGGSSSKTVLPDMLSMLEAKLPTGSILNTGTIEKPGSNPFLLHQRVQQMEEETKKLKAKFEELASSGSLTTEGSMTVGTQASMKAAVDALEKIVEDFNKALIGWYKDSGCEVSFSWKYEPKKILEISGVDVIVYRKPPPGELTIREALEQVEDLSVTPS